MIELDGLKDIAGFIRNIDLAMLELDQAISREFEKWTKMVFEAIVDTTPQFTGDLATAWNYSVNSIDETYAPIPNKLENQKHWSDATVFIRGDVPAVALAVRKAQGVHPTWRDVVYIHNPAPIAERVENQTVKIRTDNLVDGRVAMVQYYVDKFNQGGLRP